MTGSRTAGNDDGARQALELARTAQARFETVEAAAGLKRAEADGYTNLEAFWALNRATASCELGWARSLARTDDPSA